MSPKHVLRPVLMSSVAIVALGQASPVLAQCVLTPTAGDDAHICDIGTSAGGLGDPDGSHPLTPPAGGTATAAGGGSLGAVPNLVVLRFGQIHGLCHTGQCS